MESTWHSARKELRPLVSVTAALLLITAVAYPLAVTAIAQAVFNRQANGSIITVDGKDMGSSLIGQAFAGDEYFHGRPSAAGDGYDAAASSGSNLGPTSAKLIDGIHDGTAQSEDFEGITDRVKAFRESNDIDTSHGLPSDSVTASASGLDPHISPATARLQISRVAAARGVDEAGVRQLVDHFIEGRAFGFIGQPRVNVLRLNLALDARFPMPQPAAPGAK